MAIGERDNGRKNYDEASGMQQALIAKAYRQKPSSATMPDSQRLIRGACQQGV